jgi:hypothetical protein
MIDADLPKVGSATLFAQFGTILETGVLVLALMAWLAWRARLLR